MDSVNLRRAKRVIRFAKNQGFDAELLFWDDDVPYNSIRSLVDDMFDGEKRKVQIGIDLSKNIYVSVKTDDLLDKQVYEVSDLPSNQNLEPTNGNGSEPLAAQI